MNFAITYRYLKTFERWSNKSILSYSKQFDVNSFWIKIQTDQTFAWLHQEGLMLTLVPLGMVVELWPLLEAMEEVI